MNRNTLKRGLIVEDRITLLNRLSAFYSMSDFFFSLDKDTVRTANDHNISVELNSDPISQKNIVSTAEKIKEICDKLKLLDVVSTDNGNIVRKKTLLRRKLLHLTKQLTEIR